MQDVADDRDPQPFEAAELGAQRHEIEQRLRRMRVRAVAGVDDVAVERFGQPARKAGLGVAHDDDAHADRAQRDRGVGDRLAFAEARGAGRERDDVGADALFGQRERRGGARAGFEEEIENRDAGEQRASGAGFGTRPERRMTDAISSRERSSMSSRLRGEDLVCMLPVGDGHIVARRRLRRETTSMCSRRLVGMSARHNRVGSEARADRGRPARPGGSPSAGRDR